MTALVDPCERRLLMAAVSTAVMDSYGDLTITGTAGRDHVHIVEYNGSKGVLRPADAPTLMAVFDGDHLLGFFHSKPHKGLFINLGNGDDTLEIEQTSRNPIHRLELDDLFVYCGAGNDFVSIDTPAISRIKGGAGRDTLYGGPGGDLLSGGDGNDVLVGRGGDDRMNAGGGNDLMIADANPDGADWYEGDDGIDTLDYSLRTQGIAIIYQPASRTNTHAFNRKPNGPLLLDGRTGKRDTAKSYSMPATDTLYGAGALEKDVIGDDIENFNGSHGDDVIVGTRADNVIHGNRGNDWIVGGLGNDSLYGDAGDDKLFSADTRGGELVVEPTTGFDHVDGGVGNDVLRIDGHDMLVGGEVVDQLPFLTV